MLAVIYIILILLFIVTVGFFQKKTNAICKSKARLDGKTAIVTGGTSGMGLKIALDFADRGARVIVACPFIDEGTQGRKKIIEKTGNEDVVFKLLDLSSNASIRKFASDILNTEKRLDILVNNAGIGAVDQFITKDGLNIIMQVNYFGAFLLTVLLLPLLRKSGTPFEPARILVTASLLHFVGSVNIEKINNINDYLFGSIKMYGNSKLCLVLFARELSKKIKGTNVVINCVDPGLVGTTIFNSVGKVKGKIFTLTFLTLSKTPWEGAQTAIHVSLDKKAGLMCGEYFRNCKTTWARRCTYDDDLARKLWDESVKLVRLSEDELRQCISS